MNVKQSTAFSLNLYLCGSIPWQVANIEHYYGNGFFSTQNQFF